MTIQFWRYDMMMFNNLDSSSSPCKGRGPVGVSMPMLKCTRLIGEINVCDRLSNSFILKAKLLFSHHQVEEVEGLNYSVPLQGGVVYYFQLITRLFGLGNTVDKLIQAQSLQVGLHYPMLYLASPRGQKYQTDLQDNACLAIDQHLLKKYTFRHRQQPF